MNFLSLCYSGLFGVRHEEILKIVVHVFFFATSLLSLDILTINRKRHIGPLMPRM